MLIARCIVLHLTCRMNLLSCVLSCEVGLGIVTFFSELPSGFSNVESNVIQCRWAHFPTTCLGDIGDRAQSICVAAENNVPPEPIGHDS